MATAKTAPRAAKSATEAFETFTSTSTETVRENIDRATAAMSEAQAFGKQNLEAWVASAAAAQKGGHQVTRLDFGHGFTNGLDDAGDIRAGSKRVRLAARSVEVSTQDVGTVHRCGGDTDQNLARGGDGFGDVLVTHGGPVAGRIRINTNRFHSWSPSDLDGSCRRASLHEGSGRVTRMPGRSTIAVAGAGAA